MVAARQCDHIPVEAMVRVLHRVAVIAFVGAAALACGNLATERPDSSFDSGEIRDAGGELLMIGWPDGTTMTYECLKLGDLIDIECIREIYKATACMKEVTS